MNWDRAILLQKVLDYAVKLPQYQKNFFPGPPEETHCNVFARDVLDRRAKIDWNPQHLNYGDAVSEYDYDIRSMNPNAGLVTVITSTMIKLAYDNVIAASRSTLMDLCDRSRNVLTLIHDIKSPLELEPEEANDLANEGVPVWVVGYRENAAGTSIYRHEAIVFPSLHDYNREKGVIIGQAGGLNGVFYISERPAFGAWWKDKEVRYFVFPTYEVAA